MRFGDIFGSAILAIPFYYLWHYLAPIYLPNLPQLYAQIPFWDCVGIFVSFGVLRALLYPKYHSKPHWFGYGGKWRKQYHKCSKNNGPHGDW